MRNGNIIGLLMIAAGGFIILYAAAAIIFSKKQKSIISPHRDHRCPGCGQNVLHKMCPAHGTEVYMNPNHPDWGKTQFEIKSK